MSEANSSVSRRVPTPKRFTSAYTDAKNERYGVRNPLTRNMPVSKAPTKSTWMEDTPVRFATINTKVAATEIRSSNRPIPGPPGGNIENSRCTVVSLFAMGSAANPNWSYTSITLSRDSILWEGRVG